MQFNIPQFIDIEDRIFGPLTVKQFIYVLGAAGAGFLFYSLFPLVIAVFFIVPISGVALLLAFYKVNNRPFSHVLESAFRYVISDKLYLWKKEKEKTAKLVKIGFKPTEKPSISIPKITEGKLGELSWRLDVREEASPPNK